MTIRTKHLALPLAAAACLAGAPAAVAQKPGPNPGPTAITVNPTPLTTTFGSPFVITGQITKGAKANQVVTLQADPFPYGDGFQRVADTRTNSEGAYSFVRTGDRNTNYRVRSGTARADLAVRVRSVVSLSATAVARRGRLVRFSGTVTPAHTGRFVRLQRRNPAGVFVTIRSARLLPSAVAGRSFYATSLRVFSTGYYRVVHYYDGDHLTTFSPVRRVLVIR